MWDRRVILVLVLVACGLAFAAGVRYAQVRQDAGPAVAAIPVAPEREERPATLKVHVSGAVARPGVYELAAGARVEEALRMAGPLPEAEVHALNLAASLADGQKIVVPKKGEAVETPTWGSPAGGAVARGKININSASAAELETLPGIGPTLAQRIVTYREEHGPFRSVEDIKNVPGIGEGRFGQIKDLITVY